MSNEAAETSTAVIPPSSASALMTAPLGARFVDPLSPVRALGADSSSTQDTGPGSGQEGDGGNQGDSPSKPSLQDGIGNRVSGGDHRHRHRPLHGGENTIDNVQVLLSNGTTTSRLSGSKKMFAISTPLLAVRDANKEAEKTGAQTSDRDREFQRRLSTGTGRASKHLDTSVSVKVQPKPAKSAPQRSRSITITSTRMLTPAASRWPAITLPAQDDGPQSYSKSSWDVLLGRNPSGHGHGANPRLFRSESNPACVLNGRQLDAKELKTGRSEPALQEHLVRFVCPETERCVSCRWRCEASSGSHRDASVQAPGNAPLRLYVLPQHLCRCGSAGNSKKIHPCAWLIQALLCQVGLAIVITLLACAGAAAFNATEGPHEEQQARQLSKQQKELVIRLATELRQVLPEDVGWKNSIARSIERHEAMVLQAAAAGYGEGGGDPDGEHGGQGARIWTYPGSFLFAFSLLTTLGFGAPVPRTPLGRLSAIILAVLGIPLNLVLALQIGHLLCHKLSRLAPFLLLGPTPRARVHPSPPPTHGPPPTSNKRPVCPCGPKWLTKSTANDCDCTGMSWAPLLLPLCGLLLYYVLGMFIFGPLLSLPVAEWLLFPLSLTAAGGVARVPGWLRVMYAMYLEGGLFVAAGVVALLQLPATTATTDIALKLGILNMDEYYGV